MKTSLQPLIIAGALLMFSPPAGAAIYEGSWKNKTFGSTGALTIDLKITKSKVSGSLDLDGPVFGQGDPPAIPFSFNRKSDGSGGFKKTGTAIGDLNATFTADGDVTLKITNIPGGFLKKAVVDGKFNLKLQTFKATYQVDDSSGPYANGTASAHVPKPPAVQLPAKVDVGGKTTGSATAKVTSNTKIIKATASSPDAAVTVSGGNPYQIKASNLHLPVTAVKFSVTNADGLKTAKTVKFIRSGSAALLLE